jgi:hypothetical protein
LANLGKQNLQYSAELLAEAVAVEDGLDVEVMDGAVDVDEVGLV